MKDASMTNQELIEEMSVLKQRITELEQSESKLNQSERELNNTKDFIESILDNLTASLIVLNPTNYTILGANKTFIDSYGLDKNTVIGKHCYELTYNRATPCSHPNDICPLAETLKTGKPSTAEHIHYDNRGNKLYVEVSTIPIIGKGGEIHQIIHLSRNITERKRTDQALKESEERFRKIFHDSPLGMATSGSDFHFLSANEAFCRILGYSAQELTSLTFKDVTHPDHVVRDTEQIQKLLAGVIPVYQTDKRYVRKDGRIIWGTVKILAMRGRDGQFEHFLVMLEDTTEAKEAEIKLRESESKYRSLASTADLLYLVDRDCRYLFANDNYLERFGPMRDQIILLPHKKMLPKELWMEG